MDMYKKRREHNTKRVGEVFRGNKWDLNKESVHQIPRTADKVEPKAPESGHPGSQFNKHESSMGGSPEPKKQPKATGIIKGDQSIHPTEIPSPHMAPYNKGEEEKNSKKPKPGPHEPNNWPDDEKPHGGISPKPKPVGPKPGLPGLKKEDNIKKAVPSKYEMRN